MTNVNRRCLQKVFSLAFLLSGNMAVSNFAYSYVLSFGWKDGQTGYVRSKISENGGHSIIHYRITRKTLDAGQVEIAFSDASFETKDGPRPIDVIKMLPSLVVDKDGNYQGLKDVGNANKKLLEKIPIEIDEKERERWKHKLEDPALLKSMNQRFEGVWNAWVGSWNGLTLEQDYGFETGARMSIPARGRVLDYEYLGGQRNFCERCVKLRCESNLGREEAILTVQSFFDQSDVNIVLEDAGSTTFTEVVTDVSNLLPYYAKTSTHVVMKIEGMDMIRRDVTQEYWFDWIP